MWGTPFKAASDAFEKVQELNADEIIINDKWQFGNVAYKDKENNEYLLPDGESFNKKYAVNSVENTAVVEKTLTSSCLNTLVSKPVKPVFWWKK